MDEQNNGLQYSDSDVAKLTETEAPAENTTPAEDDMFEDLYTQWGQQEAEPVQEGLSEQPVEEEGNLPEEETETEADVEAEPPMEEGGEDEGINVDDVDTEGLSPEVLAILDSIEDSDMVQSNAQDQLSQAIESWDMNAQRQSYDDLMTAINERDRQIEQLIRQIANERAESDRLLDENMLANTNNRESQRFMDALADNPLIKDILVYSMNGDKEEYQAKLKDATRQLYEETNWVNVDDLMEERKRNEKMGMGEWAYDTTGVAPSNGNDLGGMLEDIS